MHRSATLTVNLSSLRANYRFLKQCHAKKNIAAVVKANAYGLGVAGVSQTLANEGCELFFVATLDEGIELRAILPDARIAVFNGLFKGEEAEYEAYRLMPVLNSVEQLTLAGPHLPVMAHVDTGMTRLGLSEHDLSQSRLPLPNCVLLLSHLACATPVEHPKNAKQLVRLMKARQYFPSVPVSFVNSSGHFLPEAYHFDIGRPGSALYGINPTESKNPMQPVATLSAPILQIRELEHNEDIGYGATYTTTKGSRIAIVGLGYADGYFRSLSNTGFAYMGGHRVPIAGRISMDMIALDITHIPESAYGRAEFINDIQTVDDIAAACHTIGYEIFTRIGRRVQRVYTEQ